MLNDLPSPLIFAHRGMSAYAPENTLAAFKMAFDAGADGIELDVRLTADDEIIVFHDNSLHRITGINKKVNETTLAELKTFDAGTWFNPSYSKEKIPSLREVFEIVDQDKLINIELKGSSLLLVDKVINLIKEFNNHSQLIVSAFNSNFLRKTKSQMPELQIGLLALPSLAGLWHRKVTNYNLKPNAIHAFYRDVNAKMINNAHAKGQRVHAYTVNDPVEMENLFLMNIDMIFTDDPALGMKVRQQLLR